jgi:hypothetical protein
MPNIAQAVRPRRPGFEPRSRPLVFVAEKVFLGQVFSKYFGFPCQFSAYQQLNHVIIEAIQSVPGGKANILGCHSIGHSKQRSVYVHVSYSERFPRQTLNDILY